MKTLELTDREMALVRGSLAANILEAGKVCETDKDVRYIKELMAIWRKVCEIHPVKVKS